MRTLIPLVRAVLALSLAFMLFQACLADDAPHDSAQPQLPIREVTIYKNGYAFILRSGSVQVQSGDKVVLDNLQTPVMGTFWPALIDPKVKLISIVAGQKILNTKRDADSFLEMLHANIGASVSVTENTSGATPYKAVVVGAGDILRLQTDQGLRVIPQSQLQSVTFLSAPVQSVPATDIRDVLTLQLGSDNALGREAEIGLVYLQHGLQWIPSYRITLNGNGSAHVEMQATIVNDLEDLNNVTANLAIGVPSFAMQDTLDPIGLPESAATVAGKLPMGSTMGQVLSNGYGGVGGAYENSLTLLAPPDTSQQTAVSGSEQMEDLFVYTVKHINLKKGERMVAPIEKFNIPYQDVYKINMPFTPTADLVGNINMDALRQISDSLAPHADHYICLTNTWSHPITTAPALILSKGVLIAQGKTTYTASMGTCDVDMTTAIDVKVDRKEHETGRQSNVMKWEGYDVDRVNLAGTLDITNYKQQTISIEVNRYLLGFADSGDSSATIDQTNLFDDQSFSDSGAYPAWISNYSWPQWWAALNGVGKVSWTSKMAPGKSAIFNYTWHYFWR